MKRIFAAVLTLCVAATAYAQNTTNTAGRTTFGIRAGINLQNINGSDAVDNDLSNDMKTGFHAGVNAEIPIGTGFYLQPGLLYSTKGAEWSNGNDLRISYIELPVNFLYKPLLGTGNMLLGFGPYAALAVGGKIENAAGTETDLDFDADYNAANAATQFEKFDAGGNLLVGYEFANRLSFQLNAQLGLVDINKENPANTADKTRWRNTGFGLSMGFRF